jgi:hypothetical protein
MAGDWLKVQYATPTKPEMLAVASRLGLDPDTVFARWFRIWCWADANLLKDGHAANVTMSHLDRVAGVTGIAQAFADEGWITVEPGGLTFANFDRHNGKSAKERELASERQRARRAGASRHNRGKIDSKRREEKTSSNLLVDDSEPPQENGPEGKPPKDPPKLRFGVEHSDLAKHMFARIQDVMPGTPVPNYGKWAHDLRVMSERDGLPLDVIEQIFDWANADDFWKTNIKSPGKLRKQFPTLVAQMKGQHGKPTTHGHRNQSGRPAVKSIEA